MNQAKLQGIGWVEVEARTDGFYYGLEKIADSEGEIVTKKVSVQKFIFYV